VETVDAMCVFKLNTVFLLVRPLPLPLPLPALTNRPPPSPNPRPRTPATLLVRIASNRTSHVTPNNVTDLQSANHVRNLDLVHVHFDSQSSKNEMQSLKSC
jgi:hypothetical protein